MNAYPKLLSFSFFLVTLMALPLYAQLDRATLKGTVTDATGAAVPGAEVQVLIPATGFTRTVHTSAAGEYVLPGLPLGQCTITAIGSGFAAKKIDKIALTVGDTRTVDVQLGVASEQSVSVSASTATLDEESAATGGVIGHEQVQNLPINGRNWAGLMILAPGAINTGSGNQTSIRFAGHGLDDNKIMFDGVDATGILRQSEKSDLRIQISSESIAEFRVNSALYSAEFGGTGGGQGDVVSRTGSNQFHGSVYEFLRNDRLNARALFSTRQLPLRLNQFGGSFGGPIVKDHTFFFLNYEGLRQRVSTPLTGFVPSPTFLQQTIQITPAIAPLLRAYPTGQTQSTTNANVYNWTGSGNLTQSEDFGLFRLDQQFSPKTSAFVRVNLDQGRLVSPNGDGTGTLLDSISTQNSPKNGVISVQHIFLPTLLSDAKVSVNRTPFTTQNVGPTMTQLAVTGFTTLHDNLYQIQNSTAYSFGDTTSWSFGRSSLSFGGGLRRVEINLGNSAETQFSYTSLAKFAANTMDSANVLAAVPTEGVRKTEYNIFLQDQYKLRPNITLSLGLRYDYFGVFNEVHGRDLPFDPLTCRGFCKPGSSFYNSDPTDIGPRVAATWAPTFLHDQTVLRGGYGLYFGEGQLGDLTGPLNNLTSRLALTSAQIPGLSYPVDPFLPLGATIASAPRGLYRGRVNEQINQWGLSVQQKMPFQILTDIGYIGSHGAHLPSRTYLNVLDPVTKTRPLPAFGQVDFKKMGNSANFAGLTAALSRQFSSGLYFAATYLWSHSTNDGSTGGGEQDYPQNVACRICERASSDQDIRSNFTASAIYELPFGHGRTYLSHGVASQVLGGWQLSGIGLARTGLPVNVTISRSAASIPDGNSTSPQRPNLVPGVSFLPTRGRSPQHWINLAGFTAPGSRTFGNAPRNLLRGPGTWQIDTSLEKNLFTRDRFAFKFRADGFNIFNHAEYGLPATNVSAPNFGQITTQLTPGATGTGTQRVFQLSVRLSY